MKRILYILILLLSLSTVTFAENSEYQNDYPIIFVHGFFGWGPTELNGFQYWGGNTTDLLPFLRSKNFRVEAVGVGPISSNYDRACELFYQIKGGRVDYGAEHSQKFGHKRFGYTYPGLYKKWDANNPIHLVGHSMGGQTSRMLSELLARDHFGVGSDETWVKSISSIATPHNGTTVIRYFEQTTGGMLQKIVGTILALAGTNFKFYDFKLDHWQLKQKDGETFEQFMKRVEDTLGTTQDFWINDFDTQKAKKLNEQIRNFATIYYFSYAGEETFVESPDPGHEVPEPAMNPILNVPAVQIGKYEGKDIAIPQRWWKNDGLVSVESMKGPHNATIVPFAGVARMGVWNYMGVYDSRDHLKTIGLYPEAPKDKKWLEDYYFGIADTLYRLK